MHKFSTLAAIALSLFITACSDGKDTILAPSSLTVVSTAAPEGAPGEMRALVFRVTLTSAQNTPVILRYATRFGSATDGEDYLATAGEMQIPAGALEGFIRVDLIGDATEEAGETFILEYSSSANAIPTAAAATGTIANDDTPCDTDFSKTPNPWLVDGGDPLNFAHRGGVIDFPENTLYAYAEAAKAGADVLEMDVYETKDNQLVILHDLDVDRTTNGSGLVVDLTLAELRALDAAYWFVPGAGTPHDRPEQDYAFRGIATGDIPPPAGYSAEDFRIPTLEEALARFPHKLINVELKPDLDGEGQYERNMAELLQRYGRSTDVIAASFVDAAALNFKMAAPCVYTSIPLNQGTPLVLGSQGPGTIPPVPDHITWQVPPDTSRISQISDELYLEIVNADFISDSHAANLAVQVWTINSCSEMLRMIDLGVDAIMTDRPLLLEEILSTPAGERSCD